MVNVFRKAYRELTDEEKAQLESLKTAAETLYDLFEVKSEAPQPREIALAKTNLEQAVMWAVKAITA